MGANDPRAWPIWTTGACLAGFMQGTTKQCYILNIQALGLVISEKKIFSYFPHYKPMVEIDAPGAWQILAPGQSWQDL